MTRVAIISTANKEKRLVILTLPGGKELSDLSLPGDWSEATESAHEYVVRKGFTQLNITAANKALPGLKAYIK